MELRYPFILFIGILILIILSILKFKNKEQYKKGIKVANTKYLKDNVYYKNIMKKYKIVIYVSLIILYISIILSIILIARPIEKDNVDKYMYNRDVFLCMDISTSVNKLNEELVNSLKEVVKQMKGERFGITIFNTSSVLLVPLTDDYEYVLEVLDILERSLNVTNNSEFLQEDYFYLFHYINGGTLVGNEVKGSSIISEGLASCVYNFSNIEEDRSRVIIFSTDNQIEGESILTLDEAANICKEKNITVFGIAPEEITTKNKTELENAVNLTGGSLYINSKQDNVKNIVDSIESKRKTLSHGKKETVVIDKPQVIYIILAISILSLCIFNKKVNI